MAAIKIPLNLPSWSCGRVLLGIYVGCLLVLTPIKIKLWALKIVKFSFAAMRPRCQEGKLRGILFAAMLPPGYGVTLPRH